MSEASAGTAPTDKAVEALTGLVMHVAGELVDQPDLITISADRRGHHIAIRLELPEEHLGQVIGRGGRIARSLRTALMITGARHDVRVSLDIEGVQDVVEPEDPEIDAEADA